ncbi:MAG: hypothetical protein P4M11_02370 [Candidatus Pacebacteria bacterium]|nr:hypothetical protein [Candidatus Paceibacterota bacterium]
MRVHKDGPGAGTVGQGRTCPPHRGHQYQREELAIAYHVPEFRFTSRRLRITIESKERGKDSAQPLESGSVGTSIYCSALNLIDLAGSECATAVEGHTAKKEMSCINKVRPLPHQ